LKLVLRILQSARVDLDRLLLSAKRERALPVLAWFSQIIPTEEINEPIAALQAKLMSDPPRDRRRPDLRYSPARLLGRAAHG
jgi:hypothetical protein